MRQAEGPAGTLLFLLRPLIVCGALLMSVPFPRLQAQTAAGSGPQYAFRSEADLLSVPVRVTDRNDNEIHGLTANQFSLYEDGKPQKIAFFDAGGEPVSLGILLDVSDSMRVSAKLAQARDALSRIVSEMRPIDEILYLRFHVEVEKVVDFTGDQRRLLAAITQTSATENDASLYDAIARGLCYMRHAHHRRQALLVIADGTDANSRRSLEDLVPIVQASQAQVFIIGCLGKEEYDLYRKSTWQNFPLVTRQEIDNPVLAFNQLARESGAEPFFLDSADKLPEAINAVVHQLRTQYTLAYYPQAKSGGFHRIEVRVAESGARVQARRGFAEASEPSAGCENEKLKPYPYESKVTTKNGCTVYHEDFQDVSSGWPNKKGYHYKSGGYEMVNGKLPPGTVETFDDPLGGQTTRVLRRPVDRVGGEDIPRERLLVANGPSFGDLNASVSVQWEFGPRKIYEAAVPGLVFHLDNRGFYAVLVRRDRLSAGRAFKLVEKYHAERITRDLLPWTELPHSDEFLGKNRLKISVQCRGPLITISVQDTPVAKFEDEESDFKQGIVGMAMFGEGSAIFRDLLVEEVRGAGREAPLSHGPGAN